MSRRSGESTGRSFVPPAVEHYLRHDIRSRKYNLFDRTHHDPIPACEVHCMTIHRSPRPFRRAVFVDVLPFGAFRPLSLHDERCLLGHFTHVPTTVSVVVRSTTRTSRGKGGGRRRIASHSLCAAMYLSAPSHASRGVSYVSMSTK